MKERVNEIFPDFIRIGVEIIVLYLLCTYVGCLAAVAGSSMETTIQDGDMYILDKWSYRVSDPERFDVVVFPYKYEENTYYIKRIIGLPGETVKISEGKVFIDGIELKEDIYCDENIENPGIAEDSIVLGEEEYFVLGDNRNNSHDSRYMDVGVITKEELLGKASLRIYPFNEIGMI